MVECVIYILTGFNRRRRISRPVHLEGHHPGQWRETENEEKTRGRLTTRCTNIIPGQNPLECLKLQQSLWPRRLVKKKLLFSRRTTKMRRVRSQKSFLRNRDMSQQLSESNACNYALDHNGIVAVDSADWLCSTDLPSNTSSTDSVSAARWRRRIESRCARACVPVDHRVPHSQAEGWI